MPRLADFRRSKDEFFRDDPHSPLTPGQRRAFTGLSYYAENPALRLVVELEALTPQRPVTLNTSTGSPAPYSL